MYIIKLTTMMQQNAMDNNQNKSTCYVFSRKTLDIAIQDWLTLKIKLDNKKEEQFQIFVVALPWLLDHIQADASIYMFTQDDLVEEIRIWKTAQIEHYPKQQKRIDETCGLIINFFQSEVIKKHKMLVDA